MPGPIAQRGRGQTTEPPRLDPLRVYTTRDAQILGVDSKVVDQLAARGDLPARRLRG